MVEQDRMQVDIYRREDDWGATRYVAGDLVEFVSIELTLAIEEIYDRIVFAHDIINKPIRIAKLQ